MGDLAITEGESSFAVPGRMRFQGISSRAYEHPADRTALVALRKLPGVDTAVKKFQGMFSDRVIRMEHLGTSVRTSERQFGRMHAMLRDAAGVLDLERVPEMYVRQTPVVNALTMGMNEPFIVLNTGLVDLMSPDELRFVLGHELGHAMSGHSLYRTIAVHLIALGSMAASVPLGGIGLHVILAALGEWMRKSELSCDRAGLLVTQDRDTCLRALMKLAGGAHLEEMNVDEFLLQAAEFAQVGDVRDTVVRVMLTRDQTHPLAVVRVAELDGWARGSQYAAALTGDYPLRSDDQNVSLSQEVRESATDYGRHIKSSSKPMITKGIAFSQRIVGRRKGDDLELEAPPEQPPPSWPAAPPASDTPSWPAAPPVSDAPSWPPEASRQS
jgi:Zn-dependent protease with chaperone function